MRLTLRTLLAWLDDSLPPKDVTRIGRQLHKSKFAQDLSRRIRKVVRQRRLTVPGMGKNTPIDANVIAAYLDNNLSPDQTTAVESLCLNSDVHLAEVAAAHQILTMLDQPLDIGPDVSAKYYRLVKGPEARMPADRWDRVMQEPAKVLPTELTTEGWPGEAQFASDLKQANTFQSRKPYYISAVCLLALASLGVHQWLLSHFGDQKIVAATQLPQVIEKNPAVPAEPAPAEAPDNTGMASELKPVEIAKKEEESSRPTPQPDGEPLKKADSEPPAPLKSAEEKSSNLKPADKPVNQESVKSIGLPELSELLGRAKTDFYLISPIPESLLKLPFDQKNEWDRLTDQSIFKSGLLRFASAEPVSFDNETAQIGIQSGALVEFKKDGSRLFHSGQIRIAAKKDIVFDIPVGKSKTLELKMPADSILLVSQSIQSLHASHFSAGKPASLEIVVELVKGTAEIEFDKTRHTLEMHQSLSIEPTDVVPGYHFKIINRDRVNDWPADTGGNKLTTEMLGRYFSGKYKLPVAIVEAETDTLKPVRQAALNLAAWIDRDDLVVSAIADPTNFDLNRMAVNAWKNLARTNPKAAARVFTDLTKELDLGFADTSLLARLLADVEPKPDIVWKKQLVESLANASGVIRMLAIEQLMAIAKRDDLGYSPEKPTEKAINAWKTWLDVEMDAKP